MDSEPKLQVEEESDEMRRANVDALSEDEEVITVRAPIATLLGEA